MSEHVTIEHEESGERREVVVYEKKGDVILTVRWPLQGVFKVREGWLFQGFRRLPWRIV